MNHNDIRFCMILPARRKYKNECMVETPRAEFIALMEKMLDIVRDPTISGVCFKHTDTGAVVEAIRSGGTA